MKKFIVIILCFLFIFSFCGCDEGTVVEAKGIVHDTVDVAFKTGELIANAVDVNEVKNVVDNVLSGTDKIVSEMSYSELHDFVKDSFNLEITESQFNAFQGSLALGVDASTALSDLLFNAVGGETSTSSSIQ